MQTSNSNSSSSSSSQKPLPATKRGRNAQEPLPIDFLKETAHGVVAMFVDTESDRGDDKDSTPKEKKQRTDRKDADSSSSSASSASAAAAAGGEDGYDSDRTIPYGLDDAKMDDSKTASDDAHALKDGYTTDGIEKWFSAIMDHKVAPFDVEAQAPGYNPWNYRPLKMDSEAKAFAKERQVVAAALWEAGLTTLSVINDIVLPYVAYRDVPLSSDRCIATSIATTWPVRLSCIHGVIVPNVHDRSRWSEVSDRSFILFKRSSTASMIAEMISTEYESVPHTTCNVRVVEDRIALLSRQPWLAIELTDDSRRLRESNEQLIMCPSCFSMHVLRFNESGGMGFLTARDYVSVSFDRARHTGSVLSEPTHSPGCLIGCSTRQLVEFEDPSCSLPIPTIGLQLALPATASRPFTSYSEGLVNVVHTAHVFNFVHTAPVVDFVHTASVVFE